MKFSLIATFLILAIGGIYGLMNRRETTARLDLKQQLGGRTRQLGITPTDPRRPRPLREVTTDAFRIFASDFTAFGAEVEQSFRSAAKTDPAYVRRLMEIKGHLVSLDAAQLKSLIDILRAEKKLTAETRGNLVTVAMSLLAEERPSNALSLYIGSLDLLENNMMAQQVAHSALREWAAQDPTAALAWAKNNGQELPDGMMDELNNCVIVGIAEADPKLAFKLLEETDPENAAASIKSFIVASKTPSQRTAVLAALREHLAKLPAGAERDELLHQSLETMGQSLRNETFATASTWLDAAKLSPTESVRIAAGLSYFYTKEDTGLWIDWMAQTLPKGTSAKYVNTLVGRWTQQDYLAAGKWLNATPAGETKDAAVQTYARTVAKYEPQTAVQWALTLPAGPQRQSTMESIYRNWPPAQKDAAVEFANQYGIDPTLKP